MALEVRRRLLTVEDYEQMRAAGIFASDERVELLAGEIITMSPIGDDHVFTLAETIHLVSRHLPPDLRVSAQSPLRLDSYNEPQPDLLVARQRGDIARPWPTVADTLLVLEVAHSSLHHDRNTKFPLYAAAGIPEAWLFDLVNRRIERHTQPHSDGYGQIIVARRGETIESLVIPGLVIPVNVVLGL
jgi:Uma2 family endonuclease